RKRPTMAVKIRLMRVGKKKQPSYRVVVADGRQARDGRFIEIIGHYAPRQEPSGIQIDDESALAWLHKGAQPTEQVQKLLTVTGVWARYEEARGKPARTKLSSRAFMASTAPSTGAKAPSKPSSRPAPAPAAAAAPEAAPEASAPPEAEPAAEATE